MRSSEAAIRAAFWGERRVASTEGNTYLGVCRNRGSARRLRVDQTAHAHGAIRARCGRRRVARDAVRLADGRRAARPRTAVDASRALHTRRLVPAARRAEAARRAGAPARQPCAPSTPAVRAHDPWNSQAPPRRTVVLLVRPSDHVFPERGHLGDLPLVTRRRCARSGDRDITRDHRPDGHA